MQAFQVEYRSVTGSVRTSATVWVYERTSAPIAVLLHGNNGTATHMTEPHVSPGWNYACHGDRPALVDRGKHGYPNSGLWSSGPDPLLDVTGWESALQVAGIGTAVYTQCDNAGLLGDPALELEAVIRHIVAQHPDAPLVLLAHSRGGLLARRFLMNVATDKPLLSRVAALITLHAPHQGTSLPRAADLLRPLMAELALTTPWLAPLLYWFNDVISADAYTELVVGSPFLNRLRAEEQQAGAPLVPTYTFGGTSTLYTHVSAWEFTPESALPQFAALWPPQVFFRWMTVRKDLLTALPDSLALAGTPEVTDGLGDGLVSEERSRLAGAVSHSANPLNHAEALWDAHLQQQVLDILRPIVVAAASAGRRRRHDERARDVRRELLLAGRRRRTTRGLAAPRGLLLAPP